MMFQCYFAPHAVSRVVVRAVMPQSTRSASYHKSLAYLRRVLTKFVQQREKFSGFAAFYGIDFSVGIRLCG